VSSPYDDRLDRSPGAVSPSGSIPGQSTSKSPRVQVDQSNTDGPPPRPGSQMEQGMSSSTSGSAFQNKSKTTSAPTSPLKEKKSSFFGKASNFSAIVSQKVETTKNAARNIRVPGINKDKCFTLLVIDDANTDWSKYFRGKRIHGDYDIRVEQAEFRELSVNSSTETGVTASIILAKSGNKVVRSFKPDFLLVRQNVRDAEDDYRSILLGFQYGNIPSVNSLESIYNFQDRPWTFAQLVNVQEKLGRDKFPLVQQTYFPGHQEMSGFSNFPCVFKVGHAHAGMGKVKVESEKGFQDVASLVALTHSYCTVEPYIDAKYDLHVQKIGDNYKALKRKSLSGNWKTNIGQSLLEEIPVSGQHKEWVDEISHIFGGIDICSVEAVVGKDDKEYIIEVNDCATTLFGESQEDDRKYIAELTLKSMESKLKVSPPEEEKSSEKGPLTTGAQTGAVGSDKPVDKPGSSTTAQPNKMMSAARQLSKGNLGLSESSMASSVLGAMGKKPAEVKLNSSGSPASEVPKNGQKTPIAPPPSLPSTSGIVTSKKEENGGTAPPPFNRKRHDSQASETSTVSGTTISSATSAVKRVELPKDKPDDTNDDKKEEEDGEMKTEVGFEGDVDTMKDLRKTFAGIFG